MEYKLDFIFELYNVGYVMLFFDFWFVMMLYVISKIIKLGVKKLRENFEKR